MSANEYMFTDRYQALGVPYPDSETMCAGSCEGMGVYPQRGDDPTITEAERELWSAAHNTPNAHEFDNGECDGYHFIKCPDCGGTGKHR